VKIAYDHILKFAAIFLTKVADSDILQALVKAKQTAPSELLPILDKIALMLNNVHNSSPDEIDEFANAVSGVGARYRDNEPVVIFLNAVLTILNGYADESYEPTQEEQEEEEALNPFAQIQEEQDYKEQQQMAGRSGRKTEKTREYPSHDPTYRRKKYELIKFENPEQHAVIKEQVNTRKKKHRENLSPEELAAQFKATNETHRKKWRQNLTPEERAAKTKAFNDTYRKKWRAKKRLEKLKQIQQG
jgi:hypothetical protein